MDGKSQDAVLKNYDRVTDMAIVSVNLAAVDEGTMEVVKIADLGSSKSVKAVSYTHLQRPSVYHRNGYGDRRYCGNADWRNSH